MSRSRRILVATLVGIGLGSTMVFGQVGFHRPAPAASFNSRVSSPVRFDTGAVNDFGSSFTPLINSYFYPSFGGYGGYFSPFLSLPSLPPPYPYMPNHWWVSPYPIEDPRQAGYNPSAGYRWDEVTTLLLATYPAKTRVTLDGIYVGTTDALGPFQIPLGEHALRIEAAGYEPSETVLKVEQPALQQLEVRLNPAGRVGKSAPRQ